VSTIWTPGGEYVPRQEPEPGRPAGPPRGGAEGGGAAGGPEGEPTPEEVAAALAQARAELEATPVADIVANHAIGLWQLAVMHLQLDAPPDGEPRRPNFAEARLAIDAMAALVEGLGADLGEHHRPLADALAQLRLAFVQLSSQSG
jgi:hypothetical protein